MSAHTDVGKLHDGEFSGKMFEEMERENKAWKCLQKKCFSSEVCLKTSYGFAPRLVACQRDAAEMLT
jgi:hypothetical protein